MTLSFFLFLQGLGTSLAQVALEGEKNIWDHPRSTLIHGSLFGENLAKFISESALQQSKVLTFFGQQS